MISLIRVITLESFYIIVRGPLLIPSIIFICLSSIFASTAAMWGPSEFDKVFFDIELFFFQLVGVSMAISWSVRLLAVARADGSLELQFASPASRSILLLGKYLGVCLSLTFFAMCSLFFLQGLMLLTDFGWLTRYEFASLYLQVLGWLVTAMLAFFVSSFAQPVTAFLLSLAFWLSAMLSELTNLALSEVQGGIISYIIKTINTFWNFQHFNRDPEFLSSNLPGLVGGASIYALALVGSLYILSSYVINKKEVIF